jgi:hypothetical protein
LGSLPETSLGEMDRILGTSRATMLGPEHGELFALETFLLRLDWLRQLLAAMGALHRSQHKPHLGLSAETVGVGVGEAGVWGSTLWIARTVILTSGASRETGDGQFEPMPGRSAAFVPPECRGGAAWVRGRCHPRGTAKTITSAKTWEFHFVPTESATETPQKGTPVRFAMDDAGEPEGTPIEGRIDVAFRDVWVVTVTDPFRWEAGLREMLKRDDGRPEIVMQPVSDHGLADDLFAIGTLWLSTLVEEPGAIPSAVRLRQALRPAKGSTAESPGPGFYSTGGGAPERRLPADLLDSALDLGNRLCGGVAGGFPGQAHEPVSAEVKETVYRAMLADVSALAADARNRIFGYAPADAELRAALEGALRP